MPLYHSSAALLGTLNVLGSGAAVCIGRKFSTKLFWPEVRASKATIIQYVGETCRYLLAAPPQIDPATGANLDIQNNVRIAFGNGLRPDVWNAFKERFGIETIAEFYAATEGTGGSWNLSRNDFTLGAVGKVGFLNRTFLGGQSAIVAVDWEKEEPYRDPKTGLARKVAPNEPGELLLTLDAADIEKGFQGYFNNKKATSGKILRSVLVKDDAYFRTGDVIRKDSEGRSYFVDRIGDTFRWKSENVSTNEVSEVMGYHAAVHEANVYGVELPHHDGRAGCAAVILAEPPSEQLMKSLAEHVKALPKFAVPLFLRITDGGGPITGTNKQQKHTLRAEGVSPEKVVGSDQIYWLKNGTYAPFTKADWEELNGGRVKL
jgi:acyl-CoA synthetase (AMP-forming)/AMP-acid ligase II